MEKIVDPVAEDTRGLSWTEDAFHRVPVEHLVQDSHQLPVATVRHGSTGLLLLPTVFTTFTSTTVQGTVVVILINIRASTTGAGMLLAYRNSMLRLLRLMLPLITLVMVVVSTVEHHLRILVLTVECDGHVSSGA